MIILFGIDNFKKGKIMNTHDILISNKISPRTAILQISAEDALYSLQEALKPFSLGIGFNKLLKKELENTV